ncbi:unnamed protein product, partial [Mesorhabditis belari]|uniref:Uncharacterized protein n=1 Tax=Mesorhabditis belari TaxID=2138241 RepID=A0AAF3F8Q4_9BILA
MIIMSTTTFLIIFFNSFLLFLLQKKRSIAESVKLLMILLSLIPLKAISSMKTDGDKRLARTAIVTHFVELITMISGCWNSMRNKFNTINGEDIWSEEFHFGAFEANTVAQIVVTIFVLHYLWPREGEKTTTKTTRTTTN